MTPHSRLLAVYDRNRSRKRDKRWYHDVHGLLVRDVRKLRAEGHALEVSQYCGIVAALSPRTQWETKSGLWNIELARRLVRTRRAPCLLGSCNRGLRILDGEPVEDVLTGPKSRSFWLNLSRPGETDAVVIDRHMASVLEVEADDVYRKYAVLAEIVRDAAGAVGLNPDGFQAAVWMQVRRENGDRRR